MRLRTIDSHIFLYVVLFKVILSFDDVLRVQVRGAVLLTSQALFRDFLMKRNTARLFFKFPPRRTVFREEPELSASGRLGASGGQKTRVRAKDMS